MIIGVLAPAEETAAIEEFFQLFKTPWETHVSGRSYGAVITSVGEIPGADAQLILAFGSSPCFMDRQLGLHPGTQMQSGVLNCEDTRLPVYGKVLTFHEVDDTRGCVRVDGRLAGVKVEFEGRTVLRLGYDLFKEVKHLLSYGQPTERARIPTLDLHIDILRQWILEAGIPVVEVPPVPSGCTFSVCLTHDIDFIGIRYHRFDHTMWGFLLRSTVGALHRFFQRRIGIRQLVCSWRAAISLPFVYLGWAKDFWIPFEWYLTVEKGLGATYYLIPFKGRSGECVPSKHPERRAAAYDVSDLSHWIARLQDAGCEIGVHGIDAWHNVQRGKQEMDRVGSTTGESNIGIRMHWLLRDPNTFRALEEAGYDYDATVGYNETPGYRAGTGQVYRPQGAQELLELPLHIQDGALFFPQRLDLQEHEAWEFCTRFLRHAQTHGGVLTILWHDRSHGPERFWGDFYARLVAELKTLDAWFGTATEVVKWFRARRAVTFERHTASAGTEYVFAHSNGSRPLRPFVLRVQSKPRDRESDSIVDGTLDLPWSGKESVNLSSLVETASHSSSVALPDSSEQLIEQQSCGQIAAIST